MKKLENQQQDKVFCSTYCLLDCDYINNHYKLIVVELSRQKELGTDSKAIK